MIYRSEVLRFGRTCHPDLVAMAIRGIVSGGLDTLLGIEHMYDAVRVSQKYGGIATTYVRCARSVPREQCLGAARFGSVSLVHRLSAGCLDGYFTLHTAQRIPLIHK